MAIGIASIAAVVVIIIIAALFLLRPGGSRYARMADKELRSQNYIPPSDEEQPPRPRPFKTANGDSNLTSMIVSTLRIIIGLAAVGVLAYIYTSTQTTINNAANDAASTAAYTGGIFKAVITLGIAAGLYIFTRFNK